MMVGLSVSAISAKDATIDAPQPSPKSSDRNRDHQRELGITFGLTFALICGLYVWGHSKKKINLPKKRNRRDKKKHGKWKTLPY